MNITDPNFPIQVITGAAGTGKTYGLKSKISEALNNGRRNYATLCATTGIAAVNLFGGNSDSVSTINSELGFFDTKDMQDKYASNSIQRRLKKVAAKGQWLAIDEMSMLDSEKLDILYMAMLDVNDTKEVQLKGGLGLILVGDFCQLPPVKAEYAFKAQCWKYLEPFITKLTKNYRQGESTFLQALNYARCGDGEKCAEILNESNIFHPVVDTDFHGTTICATNQEVDRNNSVRLHRLLKEGKKEIKFKTYRWGKQLGEWKLIPEELIVCQDAYVMILANNPPKFEYANGDCGGIVDARTDTPITNTDSISLDDDIFSVGIGISNNNRDTNFVKKVVEQTATVKLKRNDSCEIIRTVRRRCLQRETPDGMAEPIKKLSEKEWSEENFEFDENKLDIKYRQYLRNLTFQYMIPSKPYFDYEENKWCIGEIYYMPLRLAYASSCHKSQGLSLDSVQIDYSHHFFGSPSMSYVALSRCRTLQGLRIVGNEKLLESRTNVLREILRWI